MNPPAPADPGRARHRNPAVDGLLPGSQRPQPPLREVFKGLDVRELEGETVFDQLFDWPPRSVR